MWHSAWEESRNVTSRILPSSHWSVSFNHKIWSGPVYHVPSNDWSYSIIIDVTSPTSHWLQLRLLTSRLINGSYRYPSESKKYQRYRHSDSTWHPRPWPIVGSPPARLEDARRMLNTLLLYVKIRKITHICFIVRARSTMLDTSSISQTGFRTRSCRNISRQIARVLPIWKTVITLEDATEEFWLKFSR